jgi:hypothetical protein
MAFNKDAFETLEKIMVAAASTAPLGDALPSPDIDREYFEAYTRYYAVAVSVPSLFLCPC